jgi:putative restriction endonuclease
VLLHAPRDDKKKGYFADATIEGYEPDPRGHWMFVYLSCVRPYGRSVSTALNGIPRENAPRDDAGVASFHFYSNGFRLITADRFQDIVGAAGLDYETRPDLEETEFTNVTDSALSSVEQDILVRRKLEERQVRARYRTQLIQRMGAYCCMSGVSFDVPEGPSLLQVSHYWPLGHDGPDRLTNVGLVAPNIHPIYENGLVTVRDDYSLRFAPDIPQGFLAEFRGREQLRVAGDLTLDPAEENLAYHREEIFMRRIKRLGLRRSDRRFA